MTNYEMKENELEQVSGGFQQGYYDFDVGDCFVQGNWYYKILKAAHHIKGNTLVKVEVFNSKKEHYSTSNYEAWKFDNKTFLGNNAF